VPWYYGWNVLAVCMVFQAISFGIGLYSFTFWVLPWTREFGVGRGDVMTVYIAMTVAMGAISPFAGRAMDTLSIRALITVGALCFALALTLTSYASELWQVATIYGVLVPIGMVMAGPLAAQTLAAKWFSARRGLAIGVVTIGTSLGGLLIPPLVTTLQASLGWREANLVLAMLVIVAILPPVWLVIRNSPAELGLAGDTGTPSSPGTTEVEYPHWTTKSILRTRIFWVMICAFVPMAIAFGAAQQNLAPYAADHGFDTNATAYLVSLMALVMIGAKIFFGAMADRWSHRLLFMVAIGSLAAALSLMRGAVSYDQLTLMVILLGFAAGAFLPMMGAIVSSWFGAAAFGRVMGLVGPFTTLAAIGPWIAGHVRDTSGSYDPAWFWLNVTLLVAVAATLMLGGRPGDRQA
jgi:MFS family permease